MAKVCARFDRMLDARNAVEVLKGLGFEKAYIDIADKFHNEFSRELSIKDRRPASLSDVFLNSRGRVYNIDKGPLLAQDPVISGNGSSEIMMDTNVHLMVSVDDRQIKDVEQKLSELGGTLQI